MDTKKQSRIFFIDLGVCNTDFFKNNLISIYPESVHCLVYADRALELEHRNFQGFDMEKLQKLRKLRK